MKLNHLMIDNWLRINLIDIDVSQSVAHLFCGENDVGKSSLQRAIRFALFGEVFGITNKKNYTKMIRDGGKSGTVKIMLDGHDYARDVKTAECKSEVPELPEALQYALNPELFGSQKPAIRREFLFRLTGTSIKGDDIQRRAVAKGCDSERFEMVKPMLRTGGFTAAHKEAEERASEARAKWCGLTGAQRYGSKIAESWTVTIPEDFDAEAHKKLEADITATLEAIADLNTEKGKVSQKISDAERAMKRQAEASEFAPSALEAAQESVKNWAERFTAADEKYAEISAKLDAATEKCPVTCPHCDGVMRVSFITEPGKGTVAQVKPYEPLPEDELSELSGQLHVAAGERQKAREALNAATAEYTRLSDLAAVAQGGGDPITPAVLESLQDHLARIESNLSSLNNELATLQDKVGDMRAVAALADSAEETTQRAQALHQDVFEWKTIVEALAPDGIPAEILSEALKPINDRLRETSIATGWDQVSISPEIEIITNGRPYSLLGESAKWRADVAVTEAIAYLSGVNLLVVDRVDVLSPANRNIFMKWIAGLIPEYDSILMFATLKEKPSKLPKGMVAHWLASGEIVEDEAQAA